MINKYDDFLLESMLMESILVFSRQFKEVLSNMKSPLSDALLDLDNVDINTPNNYIDLSDKPEHISFITDKKAQSILNTKNIKYNGGGLAIITPDFIEKVCKPFNLNVYIENGKSYVNMEKTGLYIPISGEVGTILDKIYFNNTYYYKVKFDDVGNDITILEDDNSVINGETPFSTKRQDIKIGRGIRSILNSANIKYTDSELEKFVNDCKSEIDIFNKKFDYFELVSGSAISHWYSAYNYDRKIGTLGSSCMRNVDSERFDIYCDNKDVCSLLVLYSDNDRNLIKGRALVWKLSNPENITFMDRVYTCDESDVVLFHKYAKSNGFYIKKFNNNSEDSPIESPTGELIDGELVVEVDAYHHNYYPYLDTFIYYSYIDGILSTENNHTGMIELRDHENGRWTGFCSRCEGSGYTDCYDCSGTGVCNECGGSGDIDCSNCDGKGKYDCYECGGSGKEDCDECDGDGEIECTNCDGSGEIEGNDDEMVECSECDGSGKVECGKCEGSSKQNCERCDGDGDFECGECEGSGTKSCEECGGYGECSYCEGRGEVECEH